ncbi:MAG: U32 family peptidase [Magnetococcales bacterium]|nr:U32 family peptidase [Magnetococcales bacterium]
MMKISIGPCLFDWGKQGIADFYKRMAYETEADILYIGEVVCSKRLHLPPDELLKLAEELKKSDKEIVISTLGLIMTEEEQVELRTLAALAKEAGFRMETNDMASVGVGEGQPLVAGPHICTYNPDTLDFLKGVGVDRVVLPVELSAKYISGVFRGSRGVESEIFSYGRLPLTFSARCYTARAFNLPKANCQYKCGDYPDGMSMHTQEDKRFLIINGIETMSELIYNLIMDLKKLREMKVDIVRLSPQSQKMEEVVNIWKRTINKKMDEREALAKLLEINDNVPFCNGYFHERPGLEFIQS